MVAARPSQTASTLEDPVGVIDLSPELRILQEQVFQEKKRERYLIDAVLNGDVQPEKQSVEILGRAIGTATNRKKARLALERKEARRDAAAVVPTKTLDCIGKCYVDVSCGPTFKLPPSIETTQDPLVVENFVVGALDDSVILQKFLCVLMGAQLCSTSFITSNAAGGWLLKFRPALRTRRTVFPTNKFKEENAALVTILELLSRKWRGSKWKCGAFRDYAGAYAASKRRKEEAEVWLLCGTGELGILKPVVNHVYTAATLLLLLQADINRSQSKVH